MRKRIIHQQAQNVANGEQNWLDLPRLAQVEITSEQADHPIESALIPNAGSGWQAASAGEQTIRILFDTVQTIRCIQLLFHEDQQARTQEFVLRWSPDAGKSYQEIVRQQYTFSPPGTTHAFEDYTVNLVGVTVLELKIVPNISGGEARASLAQLRIA